MKWVTWDQSAAAAAVALAVIAVVRLRRRRGIEPSERWSWVEPAAVEFAIIASLYSVWRLARQLPFTREEGALERGQWIFEFEQRIRLPSELSAQHLIERHTWLGPPSSYYYGVAHVPVLLIFLIWLFARHRESFAHWRNGLVVLTAGCLVVRFVRVAPPRFYPQLGFVDLAARFGPDVYGPVGKGVSDQFAAMPSIHVGWAAVVSLGVVAASSSPWRWLAMLHVVITTFIVSALAQHWWLDGIVAVAFLVAGLFADAQIRRVVPRPVRISAQRAPVHQPLDRQRDSVVSDRNGPVSRRSVSLHNA